MALVAIVVIGVLLIALLIGLAWLAVSLGWFAVKGSRAVTSPRAFAELAASEGLTYAERDEGLPRSLSPVLPETFDNTVALDVLRAHVQGRDVTIFRYPGNAGGSVSVWAVPVDPAATHGNAQLTASLNTRYPSSWTIHGGFLQTWNAKVKHRPRVLLTEAQFLVRALDG
ncbi:hypothetical protein [Actinomadura macra]|uniref:hypothetical protein n=1 Tax=Actinomadura macra TaxID=46164 RepID=UPI000830E8B2|nr:hypothetical protein [Actinomadura macra]